MRTRIIFTKADFMLAYALAEDLIPKEVEGVQIRPLAEQVLVKGVSRARVIKMYNLQWTAKSQFTSAVNTIEGQILGGIGYVDLPDALWAPGPKANLAHPCYRRIGA